MAGNIEMNFSAANRRLISFPELTSATLDHGMEICRFCQQGSSRPLLLTGTKCIPKCKTRCCCPVLSSTPSQTYLDDKFNLEDGSSETTLLFACKCRGPEKYVHAACLETWLKVFQTERCAICDYKYKITRPFKLKLDWRNIDVWATLGIVSSFIYRPFLFVVLLIYILKLDEFETHISNGKTVNLNNASTNIIEPILFLLIFLIIILVIKMVWSCKTGFMRFLSYHRIFVLRPCEEVDEHL